MDELANLARIVTLRRSNKKVLLDLESPQPGKEEQLLQVMVAQPDSTLVQLTKKMYGSGAAASQTALRKLRGRLQDRLLNHLLFLDHTDSRLMVSRRYELECLDLLHKVIILYLEGEYSLTEKLLRRCLKLAEQGEFSTHAEQALFYLTKIYTEQRQPNKYRPVSRKLKEVQKIVAKEQESQQILNNVTLTMTKTVAARRAMLPKMAAYIAQVEQLHKQADTFGTFIILYRLRIVEAELTGHYQTIIRQTALADKLLREGKLNARRFDNRFNQFMSIYAHLRGRQAAAGLKLADRYAPDFHPTSSNWFYFYEHYLLLALHANEYERALRLLYVVHKNPSYTKLRPSALARWELMGAYTEFVQPPERIAVRRRNQLAVFAALSVPEYSRDKRGYNVAILVFQVLHFLQQRMLEPVLSRLERLRKYQQRHLRDAATLRSRTFLRLLMLLPEADFDQVLLARRGKVLLASLRQAPPEGEADAEIEIIPYEDLWALTLRILRDGAPE